MRKVIKEGMAGTHYLVGALLEKISVFKIT